MGLGAELSLAALLERCLVIDYLAIHLHYLLQLCAPAYAGVPVHADNERSSGHQVNPKAAGACI